MRCRGVQAHSQVETVRPRSCTSFCGACFMFRLPVDHQFYVESVLFYSIVREIPAFDIWLAIVRSIHHQRQWGSDLWCLLEYSPIWNYEILRKRYKIKNSHSRWGRSGTRGGVHCWVDEAGEGAEGYKSVGSVAACQAWTCQPDTVVSVTSSWCLTRGPEDQSTCQFSANYLAVSKVSVGLLSPYTE